MITTLGSHFRDERIRQGLSLGSVARMAGYRNLSKGANRIVRFERSGDITETLLSRLTTALNIDSATVARLVEEDRREYLRAWEEWVNQPVPMGLIAKIIPAVYVTVPLPETVATPEQAEAFACAYTREHNWPLCLALSRRLSVWIDREGKVYAKTEAEPGKVNVPWMRLKRSRRQFLWNAGETGAENG